ncbi:MAG: pyrroline-5-carboxylate reductase [Proteobacteria bacterium]|nr:pyrroline-5-carboxylate reductase [Pseudomonadota bacterium]
MKNRKFAFIGGAGKIGAAIIKCLVTSKEVRAQQITATARHKASLEHLAEQNIHVTVDNVEAVKSADVIVLAVGPEDVAEVIGQIRVHITEDPLIISIVTGVSTGELEELFEIPLPIIRVNPNIAAVVGESATVLCQGKYVVEEHMALSRKLFETVGIVEELDERHMHASTGLGGCGPAFIFKIIEAMSEGGVKMGMPRDISCRIAAQVLKGAAQLVLSTGRHPAALKDEVTTPGGCTIDGIAKLQERGIAIALIDAVETSSRKAGALWDNKP